MSLQFIRKLVPFASILIFILCTLAAAIMLYYSRMDFEESFMWVAIGIYFFAKGIFCSMSLYILSEK